MIPHWLHLISIFALVLGFAAAGVIDEMRHPQPMWIMNIVWPVVALFGTVLTIWAYFRYGRLITMEAAMNAKSGGREPSGKSVTPFPVMVGKATLHCGSGCALGDICAEWLAFAIPRNFRHVFGVKLEVDSVEFWFMMQIAMLCGFLTSYPVNWWLLRFGIKEMM
jgi:hypothetical protein